MSRQHHNGKRPTGPMVTVIPCPWFRDAHAINELGEQGEHWHPEGSPQCQRIMEAIEMGPVIPAAELLMWLTSAFSGLASIFARLFKDQLEDLANGEVVVAEMVEEE